MCPAPKIKPSHVNEPSAESALSSPGPVSGACAKTSSANHPRSTPKQEGHHGYAACLEVTASLERGEHAQEA